MFYKLGITLHLNLRLKVVFEQSGSAIGQLKNMGNILQVPCGTTEELKGKIKITENNNYYSS